jgi:sterol 3beta-glucosyltransferase
MCIFIVTWGTDGDVRPYVSLALGLKKSGHEVRFLTTIKYQEFVLNYGIESISIGSNLDSSEEEESEAIFNFPTLDTIIDSENELDNDFLDELWRVCQQAKAIIFTSAAFPCYYIADKLGIPCYPAPTQPFHQTRAFPHSLVAMKSLGNVYNLFSYSFFDQVHWLFLRRQINQWREKTLNMPHLPIWKGVVSQMQQQKIPVLYGYSPAFLPKPLDWPEWLEVTGYWFLDNPNNWQPPQDLLDFLADGSAPVYVGFGNKGRWEAEALTKLVLEALKISGQRGILLIGEDLSDDVNLPDYVFPIKWIPFDWLFPKVAAVVHHGGCGTVHTALRAGVPNIIIPHDSDNFFWGYRMAELGLAPFPIHINKLSPKRLAAAIKTAVSNQNIQIRVAALSKKVQAENGVQRAVEVIQKHLPSQSLSEAIGKSVKS